ncbi:hypothetical protein ACIO52_02665 [Nocardia sp. NPDC087230]|uniref:hypothetical protein n=1 Tax=Nocardia sp. NPDC087230 TaxID=3364331 RepID=UPI003822FE86
MTPDNGEAAAESSPTEASRSRQRNELLALGGAMALVSALVGISAHRWAGQHATPPPPAPAVDDDPHLPPVSSQDRDRSVEMNDWIDTETTDRSIRIAVSTAALTVATLALFGAIWWASPDTFAADKRNFFGSGLSSKDVLAAVIAIVATNATINIAVVLAAGAGRRADSGTVFEYWQLRVDAVSRGLSIVALYMSIVTWFVIPVDEDVLTKAISVFFAYLCASISVANMRVQSMSAGRYFSTLRQQTGVKKMNDLLADLGRQHAVTHPITTSSGTQRWRIVTTSMLYALAVAAATIALIKVIRVAIGDGVFQLVWLNLATLTILFVINSVLLIGGSFLRSYGIISSRASTWPGGHTVIRKFIRVSGVVVSLVFAVSVLLLAERGSLLAGAAFNFEIIFLYLWLYDPALSTSNRFGRFLSRRYAAINRYVARAVEDRITRALGGTPTP